MKCNQCGGEGCVFCNDENSMTTEEQFTDLIKEIKTSFTKVKLGEFTLSDYYYKMSDYFKQIVPYKGEDQGIPFDFRKDSDEFKVLAEKTFIKEEL